MNTKHQGKATSMWQREIIIHLYKSGASMAEIARMFLTKQTVSNIVNTFIDYNRLAPQTEGNYKRTARTENVVTYIEFCKNQRPSSFSKEIQRDLVNNRVCLSSHIGLNPPVVIALCLRGTVHFEVNIHDY